MENVLEILKQLPEGTKVYYTILGCNCSVNLNGYENNTFPIKLTCDKFSHLVTKFGQKVLDVPNAECLIFPSKDHRTWEDWREYYGMPMQQPEFKPFDKVLGRNANDEEWYADLFSHYDKDKGRYAAIGGFWKQCIPYEGNEHLVGTTDNP